MKPLAWGLFAVALVALGVVGMIGMQKQNSAAAAARHAEGTLQQAMNASRESHEYAASKARGKHRSLATTNKGYEEDIAKADERIAEAQEKIDEVGDVNNIQLRADMISQIAQLRRENKQMSQQLKAEGGN